MCIQTMFDILGPDRWTLSLAHRIYSWKVGVLSSPLHLLLHGVEILATHSEPQQPVKTHIDKV